MDSLLQTIRLTAMVIYIGFFAGMGLMLGALTAARFDAALGHLCAIAMKWSA